MNYIGYGLMAVVCVAFIFAGFFPDFGFMGSGSVGGGAATVNGQMISLNDFRETLENVQQDSKNRGQDPKQVEGEVLDLLIDRELFVQNLKKEGFTVADKQIFDEIVKIPAFQDKGQFSRLNYKNYLNAVKSNEAEFEEKIRRSVMLNHLSNFFNLSVAQTPLEEKIDKELDAIFLNVSYLKLNENQLVADSAVAAKEISDYLSVQEASLKQTYEKEKLSKYTTPEQVKARHILIKGVGEDSLNKIKEIKAELAKSNFDTLAKKYSEDPGSKDKGGDLGFFTKGKMVKEFEDYAFASEVGKISDPIKSAFGYHLIEVTEKKPEKVQSFDEVKSNLAKAELIKEKSQAVKSDLKAKVEAGNLAEVEALAKQNQWNWQSTGSFALSAETVPQVGALPDFMSKAMELTKDSPMAKSWVRKGDEIYVLKYAQPDGSKPKDPMAGMDFFKQFMDRQKSFQVWNKFRTSVREKAKIKKGDVFVR